MFTDVVSRRARRFAGVSAVAGATALLAFGGGAASAGQNGNGATVVRDPYGSPHGCFIVDTTGDLWNFDCKIQVVTTPDGTVKEYLKGSITSGSPLPDRARTDITTDMTGLYCDYTSNGYTSTVGGTVTPGGQVNLTCR